MLWLTTMEQKEGQVTIEGRSTTLIALSDFVGNLGNSPLLAGSRLRSSTARSAGQQDRHAADTGTDSVHRRAAVNTPAQPTSVEEPAGRGRGRGARGGRAAGARGRQARPAKARPANPISRNGDMKLSLGRLPWYAQVGAFVVLAGAGVGAFWDGYAAPAGRGLAERGTQLETLKGEIDRGLAAARQLPEFRRQLATEQAQLDRLRVVLPEERDVAELLRRVQAMATQSNLTILGFTPQAITTKETHAEWPIGLQLEGTYHNLGAFFERISRFPRIINVTGITIPAGDPTVRLHRRSQRTARRPHSS